MAPFYVGFSLLKLRCYIEDNEIVILELEWQNFSPALLAFFFAMGIQTGGLKVNKCGGLKFSPFAPQGALNWAKSALEGAVDT